MVTKLMRTKCDNQQEEEQLRGRSVRSHPQSKRERWIPLPRLKKKHITNESYSKTNGGRRMFGLICAGGGIKGAGGTRLVTSEAVVGVDHRLQRGQKARATWLVIRPPPPRHYSERQTYVPASQHPITDHNWPKYRKQAVPPSPKSPRSLTVGEGMTTQRSGIAWPPDPSQQQGTCRTDLLVWLLVCVWFLLLFLLLLGWFLF